MASDVHDRPVSAATWIGFSAMCLGMFMAILDIQIVATSLPAIRTALDMPPEQMSWVQTAYLIAEVVSIPLTGLLMRALSMRGLFCAAITAFTLASVGCAASTGFASLTAWRVIQGFAGGTLIPAVFAAVFLLLPKRFEALATTIAGALAVLAPTLGPIVGGWITETFSWHWLFLVNVLPGIVALAAGASCLRGQGEPRAFQVARLVVPRVLAWPCRPGNRLEGGAAARLVVGRGARLPQSSRCFLAAVFVRRTLARARSRSSTLATLAVAPFRRRAAVSVSSSGSGSTARSI